MTPAVDERIAERRREVREDRRRRRLRRTLTVATILAVVAIGYAIERSSLVALSEIEVLGTSELEPEAVLAAADLPLGTSTLRLDLGSAEARIAELPRVRTVEASRVDPLTVRITVEERTPALVAVAGADRMLIDAEGVVIASGRVEGLPSLVLPAGTHLPRPGATVAAEPLLAAAFAVHRQLPADLVRRVPRIDAHAPDDVDVRVKVGPERGITVRFGAATRLDEKTRALTAVLADVQEAAVSSIDVRAPSNPVVRS